MINYIKEVITSYNFIFVLITLGFIIVVALLILENRRDNMKLRLLNDKIKSLIAGEYSDIIDLQGGPELTEISNNINDLSCLVIKSVWSLFNGTLASPSELTIGWVRLSLLILMLILLVPVTTIGRLDNVCGCMGARQMASKFG